MLTIYLGQNSCVSLKMRCLRKPVGFDSNLFPFEIAIMNGTAFLSSKIRKGVIGSSFKVLQVLQSIFSNVWGRLSVIRFPGNSVGLSLPCQFEKYYRGLQNWSCFYLSKSPFSFRCFQIRFGAPFTYQSSIEAVRG